ncbi:hypothetical protein J6J34_01120 [Pseudidiomarina sp. 1ASP75-14]|uniref:hypothetical protein n=1 Tax=Pseudidiomarina terrestris TaxID=2820060 RepID=UPI00264D8465|nr:MULTISPECIES: hypothetical protein [unclassified Pseudidiomarina]MDN7126977.1 hypothetical protein [Pseudidiomarina sp. 1APR75-33.1]MDN7136818.1 hypothetical protein [Pseudidiomarina sp. 1ASP75-14]
MTSSQRQLLIFAAFLAALQFVVKPILSWQNDLTTELGLTQGQVQRSEQLLSHAEQVIAAHQVAVEQRATIVTSLPNATETTLLQIQMQDQIETLLRTHTVAIDEFNWMTGLQSQGAGIATLNAKVRIAGTIEHVAQAQLALMEQMPFVRQQSIELRPSQRRRGNVHELTIILQVAVREQGGPL